MKNLCHPIILLSIVLFSCSSSKPEMLIKQFEETVDAKTKIDLSFKVKEIHLIGSIVAKDSIDYYVSSFMLRFNDSPKTADGILKMAKKELPNGEHVLDSLKTKIIELKNKGTEYQYIQDIVDRFEPSIILIRNAHNCLEKFISTPEKVIGNKWKCTYTIVNPMLNNAKQEITNGYIFNRDNSKLISRLGE